MTTIYLLVEAIREILRNCCFQTLTEWLYDNYMIMNPKKCCYMCLGKHNNNDTFSFNGLNLKNNNKEINLGIKINQKPTFSSHIKCKNEYKS